MHATNVSLYNINIANTFGKVCGVRARSRPLSRVAAGLINFYWESDDMDVAGVRCRPSTRYVECQGKVFDMTGLRY